MKINFIKLMIIGTIALASCTEEDIITPQPDSTIQYKKDNGETIEGRVVRGLQNNSGEEVSVLLSENHVHGSRTPVSGSHC